MMWSARILGTGPGKATAYVRRRCFEIGAPVEFDEAAPATSAVEYLLSALAADVVNGFTLLARRRRVAVDAIEAVATGELNNPLTVLEVIGEEGHPGVERITVKVYVTSSDSAEDVQRAWLSALELSPLAHTLRSAVDLRLQLEITP